MSRADLVAELAAERWAEDRFDDLISNPEKLAARLGDEYGDNPLAEIIAALTRREPGLSADDVRNSQHYAAKNALTDWINVLIESDMAQGKHIGYVDEEVGGSDELI